MDISVGEALWASSMLPEGIVESWRADNGDAVTIGDVLVVVRIEDALHDILAPTSGRLNTTAVANSIIEPGSVLGELTS